MEHSSPLEPTASSCDQENLQPLPGAPEHLLLNQAPVIAVGASAGGLEALEHFFTHCPAEPGAAMVVIQHLLPDHRSMMDTLLARHTRMPVCVAEDGMPLEINRVYLIPPGKVLRTDGVRLRLSDRPLGTLTMPIDLFLTSLAQAAPRRCVAVILSGTGSDGTRGAKAINEACGLVLAQELASARFDGMPRSVMDTGVVDAVLPAHALAVAAVDFLQFGRQLANPLAEANSAQTLQPTHEQALADLLDHLREVGNIDFAEYKDATVMRRIDRRLLVRHCTDLPAYADLVKSDPNEAQLLRKELLIGVTRFFRDPEVFETLREQVIAPLVAARRRHESIRVWQAGVSTGEEAYTVAMLFAEEFERQQRACQLKLFGTDVDAMHIDVAGQGAYPEAALAELSAERRERFFQRRTDGRWAIRPDLRSNIVFARHNLLSDPPFTRMDLVICRNTLIYFKSVAQERALARMQFALLPGGHLLLGPSESLGSLESGFKSIDSRAKLYRRLPGHAAPALLSPGVSLPRTIRHLPANAESPNTEPRGSSLVHVASMTLQAAHVPPSLLVDGRGQVLHFFGDLSPFLAPRTGVASLQMERLLRPDLAATAQALVASVIKSGKAAHTVVYALPGDNYAESVACPTHWILQCLPVPQHSEVEHAVLTLLEATQPSLPLSSTPLDATAVDRINLLQRELDATRADLQATIEEMETSNEELQATNEELISANEELQSSNEELQSLNEELHTVNAEFEDKLELLHRTNADLESMTRAAGVATVFVDGEMRLTRFSPDSTRLFRIQPTDLGRRLDDFTHDLDCNDLCQDIQHTLDTQRMTEREIPTRDGRLIYLARIHPYQIPSRSLQGAVATFTDITPYHDAKRLQAIVDALPEHIAVVDEIGTIVLVNLAWRRFAASNGDPELRYCGPGTNYLQACPALASPDPSDDPQRAAFGIRQVLGGELPFFSMRYPCHSPTEKRWFVMNVAPARGFGAVVSHVNISAWYSDSSGLQPDIP